MFDNMYVSESSTGPGLVFWIFYFAFISFFIVVMWKIFVKAGKPGWGCIVPIYNIILQLEIAGRPIWWIFLMFIPLVNIVISIIILIDFAKAFGKGTGFGLGMLFLPFIFFPILAFGNSEYQETVHIESQPL
ncbi:MAG: DUF5684 domain-containing protein [Candidatus Cloacimonadota bacterium]|nr:DUF5684 domain-containing protein [Candidatus Cloacimonadota bacterium]